MQYLYYSTAGYRTFFWELGCLTGKSVIMEFGVVLPGSLGAFWVVLIVVVEREREK